MTPQAALIELLARVGAVQGAAVLINEEELSQWPAVAVAAMKSQKLIAKARSAASAICPGCERECVMPVHTPPTANCGTASFIVCDKRSDINRVSVPVGRLEQWQTTCDLIAGLLAQLLGLGDQEPTVAEGNQWHIGVLRGRKHRSRVTLLAGDRLALSLAGHTRPLTEVLAIKKNVITLDKGALLRLVDKPADKAATEPPEQRRERLRAHIREERARGTKAFLQRVAEEEGISVSRLKQLTSEETSPAGMWTGLVIGRQKGAGSKRAKPKR
ncbi:MAG: hypothetical protein FJY51_08710 [Betaproteobacteria bacterium]|nr:hypothetical protein [Betaproteobacteria bacterium]